LFPGALLRRGHLQGRTDRLQRVTSRACQPGFKRCSSAWFKG
jgi:hypothetical protein